MRSWISAAALCTGLVAVAAGCGGGSDASGTTAGETTTAAAAAGALTGSVGPGYDISMDVSGATPGTHTLVVDDQASNHNFHLTGPGVDVTTDVGGTGKKTFTVDLQQGEYTFVCDVHPSMKGTLTVG